MEEPGRLQSMGSLGVGHDQGTSLFLFTFMRWRRKWHPLQCSCLENPRDGGTWWAAVSGVTQSQTGLKQLSSTSSSDQYKEIEENNRLGKTRDVFKKIRDTKGTLHANMGTIKDRNGMDLTEA